MSLFAVSFRFCNMKIFIKTFLNNLNNFWNNRTENQTFLAEITGFSDNLKNKKFINQSSKTILNVPKIHTRLISCIHFTIFKFGECLMSVKCSFLAFG